MNDDQLAATAWKYLRRTDVPDIETLQEIRYWQQLDTDVLEAHAQWLATTKARFESHNIPWTVENLNHHRHLIGEHE